MHDFVTASAATPDKSVAPAILRLRRFGMSATDMAIDFTTPPSPNSITSVLACLLVDERGHPAERESVWQLSVSSRHAVLLAGAHLVDPRPFTFVVTCPVSECHQPIELELECDEILDFWKPDDPDPIPVSIEGTKYLLRRPTGADQRRWQQHPLQDVTQARFTIISSLVSGAPSSLSDDLIDALDQAMSELDPLVNFSMQVVCPYCDVTSLHELDLARCALRALAGAQNELFRSVHTLATGYGWTEDEILVIPPWRRQRYLALLDERGDRT